MKKKISVVAIFLVIGISFLFFSTGGKIASVMLRDYSISEEGNVMTIKVGVISSIGAKDEFKIELNPSCEGIYFYRGDGGYKLILQKNDKTKEWQLVRGQSDKKENY